MIEQPKILFQQETHTYIVDGDVKMSPTQIMESVGVKNKNGYWQSFSGSEFMNGANVEFGNEFHDYMHYRVGQKSKQKEIAYDEQLEPWVESIELFIKKSKFESLDSISETRLYSPNLDICLTPDFVVFEKGRAVVYDWKTSDQFQHHWTVQVGAYAGCIKEIFELRYYPKVNIVRPKPGNFPEIYSMSPLESQVQFNRFNSILNTFKILRG